jgi:hypothetical protein
LLGFLISFVIFVIGVFTPLDDKNTPDKKDDTATPLGTAAIIIGLLGMFIFATLLFSN